MLAILAPRFSRVSDCMRLAEFFRAQNVTVVLGEFGDMGPMITAAYYMLNDGTVYADLGPDHFRKAQPMI